MPYGKETDSAIERAIIARITPQFRSAKRPEQATTPTIAAGQATLKARLILATCRGGPAKAIKPITGRAVMLAKSPIHVIDQYPRTILLMKDSAFLDFNLYLSITY